jgi:hypothetical protein
MDASSSHTITDHAFKFIATLMCVIVAMFIFVANSKKKSKQKGTLSQNRNADRGLEHSRSLARPWLVVSSPGKSNAVVGSTDYSFEVMKALDELRHRCFPMVMPAYDWENSTNKFPEDVWPGNDAGFEEKVETIANTK